MSTSNKNFKVKNGLDASGDITTSGDIKGTYIRSLNSNGDEGGEIFLAKPQTNTTLDGTGVTIDVYQNRIRFFEQGGSARGAYIDLTAASGGVGSNLLTGGGGGSGTVTSVAMTVPTGLTISGSPVTSSGTLALTFTSGYSIPTTSSQTNWDAAYGWGNHASAGYVTATAVQQNTISPFMLMGA